MPDAATEMAGPALNSGPPATDVPPSPARDRTADASPSFRGRGDNDGAATTATGAAVGPSPDGKAGGPAPAGSAGGAATGSAPDDDDDGAGGAFDCNICYDVTREPVVTLCGHLYCWPCLYRCG
jgi:hypothetical protein